MIRTLPDPELLSRAAAAQLILKKENKNVI
jgi:hypothetical protein